MLIDFGVFSVSIAFFLYFFHHRTSNHSLISNLKVIRNKALIGKSIELSGSGIINFVDNIHSENLFILTQPRRITRILFYALITYAVVSVVSIFHNPIGTLFGSVISKATWNTIWNWAYGGIFIFSCILLWDEHRYFNSIRNLEKKYDSVNENKTVRIIVDN